VLLAKGSAFQKGQTPEAALPPIQFIVRVRVRGIVIESTTTTTLTTITRTRTASLSTIWQLAGKAPSTLKPVFEAAGLGIEGRDLTVETGHGFVCLPQHVFEERHLDGRVTPPKLLEGIGG
jgi:hypothetical protein